MIRFDIVTVFPEVIEHYCDASIIGRAKKQEKVIIRVHNLRNWTSDRHHTVDDKVFGGGPGMLMKVEPLLKAITELKAKATKDGFVPYVLATVASGELFTQEMAQDMASASTNTAYIILCGHYEGFDARIFNWVDTSISVGPYVLTGGELPSLIMIDAITRLLPGVLGNEQSAAEETTFTLKDGTLFVSGEHPQYTMPSSFSTPDEMGNIKTFDVPDILRSGHHKKIKEENDSRRVKKTLFPSK